MRLFVGIPLAPEVIEALERIVHALQAPGDELRWTSSETWHITLQFLGATPPVQADCIVAGLGRIQSPPVPVLLHETGFFDRAGVYFAGVNVSPELQQLQKEVVVSTSQCGFTPEDRPFHPHVTLARAKGDCRLKALKKLKGRTNQKAEFPSFVASEFLLYEAFLGAGGSRYEVRARFPLRDKR
jgi:RNA 2',3'-cyclic 3'-phosphodiesterase